MYKNKLSWAVAIAAATLASQASAGGYQVNEQSVSGQGYGHAGRSSNVNDATIVFGNPAGMSFLDRAQISVGGTYLSVDSEISNVESSRSGVVSDVPIGGGAVMDMPIASSSVNGTNDGDMVPGTLIPYAFYAHPVDERLAFGFGVYAPFGSKTEYEDGFEGRNQGNYTEVKVMSAQPTVSYRFNDQWAIGAGITYNRVEGELHRQVPVAVPGATGASLTELDARVEGDDDNWGYNLGVLYRPVPETTLGLTYRSKVSYTLTGDFRATATDNSLAGAGFSEGDVVSSDDASLDLVTPETVNFSVTQHMNDSLKLMAGASWTRWSRFDQILVEGAASPDPITNEEQSYSNAWAFAVGGEYQLVPQLALRAGVTIDNTPTNDATRSVRIPSDDRRIFSLGLGWTPVPDLTVDVAYSYLSERGTGVEQSKTDPRALGGGAVSQVTSNYSADYKNQAHGFGAQLTYRF